VLTKAIDDEPLEVALAPLGMNRFVFVQVEFLDRMLDLDAEGRFPVGCMRSALKSAPSSRSRLVSSPSNDADPRRLNTQFLQGSPATAGRSSSVPVRTCTASPAGSVSRDR